MAEPDSIPDDSCVFAAKKKKMNKGTAVFRSGFWRDGICENVKTDLSRGKIFVMKDIQSMDISIRHPRFYAIYFI